MAPSAVSVLVHGLGVGELAGAQRGYRFHSRQTVPNGLRRISLDPIDTQAKGIVVHNGQRACTAAGCSRDPFAGAEVPTRRGGPLRQRCDPASLPINSEWNAPFGVLARNVATSIHKSRITRFDRKHCSGRTIKEGGVDLLARVRYPGGEVGLQLPASSHCLQRNGGANDWQCILGEPVLSAEMIRSHDAAAVDESTAAQEPRTRALRGPRRWL